MVPDGHRSGARESPSGTITVRIYDDQPFDRQAYQ
ncbi:phage tail tip domain-containing protein [Escherichia coli]